MCLMKQAWKDGHRLKEEDKGLTLLRLSIRVCPSTGCIKKKPSGFLLKANHFHWTAASQTFYAPLFSISCIPPRCPRFSTRLSVCNGLDVEVREMEEKEPEQKELEGERGNGQKEERGK